MNMRTITFKTNNKVLLDDMVKLIVESGEAGSIDISAEENVSEVDLLEVVDGFVITNDYLAKVENIYLLRDAIAKHVKECEESVDTDESLCFSANTASYWFYPYAALEMSRLVKCSLPVFVEQMAVWFPGLIKDVRSTKKHACKLEGKFFGEKMVNWNTSPKVRYKLRKHGRKIAYDGVFGTLNKLRKDVIRMSVENI